MHASHSSPTTRPNVAAPAADDSRHAEFEMLRRLPARLGYASPAELLAALQEAFGVAAAAAPTTAAVEAKSSFADVVASVPKSTSNPESAIRAIVNRRLGPADGLTAESRQRQLAEREELVQVLAKLFEVGTRAAGANRPAVREFDVERVMSALRRLALVRRTRPTEVAAFCAAQAETDSAVNQLDPFLLRLVLTYHDDIPHEEMPQMEIVRLRKACEEGDADAVRAWFASTAARRDVLPGGLTAFLKREILEQWDLRCAVLDVLVFEETVLDVQMFGAIGWENSRLFFAQLARATGGIASPFLAYLAPDEIDDARKLTRTGSSSAVQTRFEQIAGTRSAHDLAQFEKRVTDCAKSRLVAPTSTAVELSRPATVQTEPTAPMGNWGLRTA